MDFRYSLQGLPGILLVPDRSQGLGHLKEDGLVLQRSIQFARRRKNLPQSLLVPQPGQEWGQRAQRLCLGILPADLLCRIQRLVECILRPVPFTLFKKRLSNHPVGLIPVDGVPGECCVAQGPVHLADLGHCPHDARLHIGECRRGEASAHQLHPVDRLLSAGGRDCQIDIPGKREMGPGARELGILPALVDEGIQLPG